MSDRFFLDTGIFAASFDKDEPARARRAYQLIRRAVLTRKGTTSTQVVQEFFDFALRRFSKPMTHADAEQYLAVVLRPLVAVQASAALLGEALRLSAHHRLGWCDSLIVAAALEAECEILYSEDFDPGQRFRSLRVENPFL